MFKSDCIRKLRVSLGIFCAFSAFFAVSDSALAELLLFDDFEYTVNRSETASDPSGRNNPFVTQGGWFGVKAENITGSHMGYLYTANQIPGYSGSFPGINSSRALVIEGHGVEGGTDFYLQYGNAESAASDNAVPADVWFQFWHYTNSSGNQITRVENRHKFIYPCAGPYPCNTDKWLLSLSSHSYNPENVEPFGNPTTGGEAFLVNRDNMVGNINYYAAAEWDASKLGQTRTNEYLAPNRWSLVKIHFDTSDPSSGKYEAWIKPMGGQFVKVADWIGGVTPNFEWTFPRAGGHRAFRMPTTIGWTNGGYNVWYYIDDFAMATSEDSLPVYDGTAGSFTPPLAPPMPPAGIR